MRSAIALYIYIYRERGNDLFQASVACGIGTIHYTNRSVGINLYQSVLWHTAAAVVVVVNITVWSLQWMYETQSPITQVTNTSLHAGVYAQRTFCLLTCLFVSNAWLNESSWLASKPLSLTTWRARWFIDYIIFYTLLYYLHIHGSIL